MPEDKKEHFARAVCLFLAEGLRTKNIGLHRAAEIAQKVLDHINLLDTEHDFLSLIKELGNDFEELSGLEKKIIKDKILKERKDLEDQVRKFSIQMLENNSQQALSILHDAAEEKSTIESLTKKYPDFKTFLQKNGGT
jgi:hypothetical protein